MIHTHPAHTVKSDRSTRSPSRRPRLASRSRLSLGLLLLGTASVGTVGATPPAELRGASEPSAQDAAAIEASESLGGVRAGLVAISPGTSWHLQLSGKLQEKSWATVYDIDLFDTPTATIQSLKSRGKVVHCYFSAGSYEDWRSDKSRFPSSVLGKPMDGWPGERWVDVRASGLRSVILARLDLAKSKGCSGVDPDNVDGYGHDTGFSLRQSDSVSFLRWLATEAHARGLSIGLKNGLEILSQVASSMDWAVNEQCNEYAECSEYRSFIASGKPVFNVEYKGTLSSICSRTVPLGLSTIKAPLALNGSADKCP